MEHMDEDYDINEGDNYNENDCSGANIDSMEYDNDEDYEEKYDEQKTENLDVDSKGSKFVKSQKGKYLICDELSHLYRIQG